MITNDAKYSRARHAAQHILHEQWRLAQGVIDQKQYEASIHALCVDLVEEVIAACKREAEYKPFDQVVLEAVAAGRCKLTTYGHEVTPTEAKERLA